MSDYIKRQDMHDLVGRMERFRWRDPETGRGRDTIDYDQVQFGIDKLPTYDIPPVRIGRWLNWKPKYIGMEYSYDIKECSECGHTMNNALIIPAYYCPNCGAKMKI